MKPKKSRLELEALIVARAIELGMELLVHDVRVRRLRTSIAGCNWIVVSSQAPAYGDRQRYTVLRQILPLLRDQYDLQDEE